MSEYNLERVSIMLVEDNSFIRQTLDDLLRHFLIENIRTFENGEKAIWYLKELKRVGHPGPDIIISDLIMSPINGQLLLRWVRTAKESPNRFVPFIMLSGAADRAFVASIRDLGVSEFLAKPFSVQTVFSRIAVSIERPRPVIATRDYFGPCRRRVKNGEYVGAADRRREGDGHITYVYSAEKMVSAKSKDEVWCFMLPNTLKEKVGGAGDGTPPTLPDEIIEQAEARLERASLDFSVWAKEYLQNLMTLCEEAEVKPDRRRYYFAEINFLAHELRGQGGTFGYPLMSVFGKMLYEATLEGAPLTDSQVSIVGAHVDAMRAVIREKISGDGGEVGQEVQSTLRDAIERYQVVE